MKKYVLLIESLVKTFSVTEAGKEIVFNYKDKSNSELFTKISINDIIFGYFEYPIMKIQLVFKVKKVLSSDSIALIKILEVSDGVTLDEEYVDELKKDMLTEISDDVYKCIINEMKSNIALDEAEKNIFDGFAEWLVSDNNLERTKNEKYNGYPGSLKRMISRMEEFGLVEKVDFEHKNPELYKEILKIYETSEKIKEYDDKSQSFAGRAALKKYIKYIEFLLTAENEIRKVPFDYKLTAGDGTNLIFYGTPGCGKSYYIEHKILGKDKDTGDYIGRYRKENIIRTTFYQDYSNTDFVGQILPRVRENNGEKTVEYIFNPGPFTIAFIKAVQNPNEKVALVVEEINRGNAPAIFGDIFQLLDRDEDNGISEYGIVNVGMTDYLNILNLKADDKNTEYEFTNIKIPGNMDIYATMNTSDQNVYTLDTAFVRRWGKEKIKNSFDECTFGDLPVPGMSEYTWKEFVESINECISRRLDDLQVNEDKQIGVYFVKSSLLKSNNAEKFAYKVLDYLWSDVTKLDHGVVFNPCPTFEKLVENFKSKGVGVFRDGIFADKRAVTDQTTEQA